MNIDLTIEEVRELNQIRNLLDSVDFESKVLGLGMFKQTSVYTNYLQNGEYKSKQNKWIPISWYVNKAIDECKKKVVDPDYWCPFETLIIPLIHSILLCESKFRTKIVFNSDRHRLMLANNLQRLENLENYFGINTDNTITTNTTADGTT